MAIGSRSLLYDVQEGIQVIEAGRPELPVVRQPSRRGEQRFGLEAAQAALGILAAGYQPGALEDLEVLGNGWLSELGSLGQGGYGHFPTRELRQDGPTRGVGERLERHVELNCHL